MIHNLEVFVLGNKMSNTVYLQQGTCPASVLRALIEAVPYITALMVEDAELENLQMKIKKSIDDGYSCYKQDCDGRTPFEILQKYHLDDLAQYCEKSVVGSDQEEL